MDINQYKSDILNIAKSSGLEFLVLFGSVARNEANSKSDIDIAVLYGDISEKEKSIISEKIWGELTTLLKRDDIEIVDVDNISSVLMVAIVRDGILFYEKRDGIFERWSSFAKKIYADEKWLRDLAFETAKQKINSWELKK